MPEEKEPRLNNEIQLVYQEGVKEGLQRADRVLINIKHLFKIIGKESKCECGAPIWFIENPKTKKQMPYTAEALNHFADCPVADKFRKKQ